MIHYRSLFEELVQVATICDSYAQNAGGAKARVTNQGETHYSSNGRNRYDKRQDQRDDRHGGQRSARDCAAQP